MRKDSPVLVIFRTLQTKTSGKEIPEVFVTSHIAKVTKISCGENYI